MSETEKVMLEILENQNTALLEVLNLLSFVGKHNLNDGTLMPYKNMLYSNKHMIESIKDSNKVN